MCIAIVTLANSSMRDELWRLECIFDLMDSRHSNNLSADELVGSLSFLTSLHLTVIQVLTVIIKPIDCIVALR